MKKIALFFMLILAPLQIFSSAGRYIRFEHILPDLNRGFVPAVSSILQDREGFMWFGTNGYGLFRFVRENEEFIQFKHDPENAESLTGNIILSIQEDKKGNLWIGTRYNGLCRYNRQNNTFTEISLEQDVNTIWDLMIDSKDNIWIGTQDSGLFKFDADNQKSQNYKHNPDNPADDKSISAGGVQAVIGDEDGIIWVGTNKTGLIRFDPATGFFTHYNKITGAKIYVSDKNTPCLLEKNLMPKEESIENTSSGS